MAFSKPSFLNHLKILVRPLCYHRHHPLPLSSFISVRLLSFATPEDAAAERRRRKRRLRIEPPLNALRSNTQPQPRPAQTPTNPNASKLPEHVSVLTGNRLNLHNRILKLIRENDLGEAVLLTRHSVYSNCRPTIFTCNAVFTACVRQSKYDEFFALHRFITQANIAANIVTYNLLIATYMDIRKTDTALEHYKQLIENAPFDPNPTTYRFIVKGLVDNNKLERALAIKDEMLSKGLQADPIVYSYLMTGEAKATNADGIFNLYEELKEKIGGFVSDGIVYGNIMKGYFLRGMEKEAMECYQEAVGVDSKIKMSDVAFNFVLDALSMNGKFDEAINLFDRMLTEHNPPKKLTVNEGSYNLMVDGYCAQGRFDDAIKVFKSMGEKKCHPDTLSYNNLIDQLCNNGMLAEAEELYNGMSEKGVMADEYTFGVLMDTCFDEGRPDDAAAYFKKMVASNLKPNLGVYNKLVHGLVKVGKVDEAKSFFELMLPKLRMDDDSYKFIMKALFDIKRHDEVLEIINKMLREDPLDFTEELQEFVKEELRKEGREEDLVKLMEDIKREKAEAAAKEAEEAERAKANTRYAVASLTCFGKNEDAESANENVSANKNALAGGEGNKVKNALERENAEAAAREAEEAERAKASAGDAVASLTLVPPKLFGKNEDAESANENASANKNALEAGEGEGIMKESDVSSEQVRD